MALRHVRRQLQRSEIHLEREGTAQAASFPEVRNEIVALKKLEQEQKEVALRIAQIEDALKKIESERAENARTQSDAIAKLEQEKKPILQRRDEAKHAAAVCERELAGVEARLQANDSAHRELLKQLSALQAQAPPPPALAARSAALASKRTRLPQERAEIVRAREGSAEACRQATKRLAVAEDELSAAERNIARIREGFETTDRALNDTARAQQEALRQAKARHQTVEERKNPAYLNIGRHLATRGIAPPNAPHLLHDVLRHRQSVQRHHEHREQLSVLSAQIDKQELRQFYFVILSILFLLAIVLPLVFQSPPKREWLPRETDAILSLNADHLDRDDLAKKWRNEDFWLQTWPGLIGAASQTPRLRIPGDAARVTRALTTAENSPPREFLQSAQLLGLGVSLQTPVKARLLLRLPSENAARDLAKSIHDDPHRWLRIEQSDLLLFAAPPEINRQHADLEIRFNIPENSARLLLQRMAKTDAPPAATAAN